ncbi:MAG: nitroreductase family protein [Planctomycetota bacterium]
MDDPTPTLASASDVLALMAAHRSVRRFTAAPVPDSDVHAAVAAAQCAATSSWIQAYALLRVEDPVQRAALVPLVGGQAQVAEAGAFFVVLADTRRHRLLAERAGAPYANNLEVFLLATVDASLFAQNLALAFEAQGYGICYIGGLRNQLEDVDRLLALPHGVYPLFGLCVGVPAEDPGTRPRLPVEAVCFTDRYPSDAEVLAQVDAFDATARAYYAARGATDARGVPRDWSGGTWRKFKAPMRPDLARYFRAKGASFD